MAIRVSQDLSRVTFQEFSSSNPLVIGYFDGLPDELRAQALERAIAIGVMALREDRIASFLASTKSELGVQLEALRLMYEQSSLAMRSAPVKGAAGELAVAQALTTFSESRSFSDSIQLIGNVAGGLPKNKTGDIICTVGDGDNAPKVVIECKLDKSIRLGDPASDGLTKGRSDTAWSQLVESRANRDAEVAIMVFSADASDRTIGAFTDSVRYIKGVGYIALIDMARGDFRPLAIAYELAREMALSKQAQNVDPEQLDMLMRKLCADLQDAAQIKGHLEAIKSGCDKALAQVDASLGQFHATRAALTSFIQNGRLDNSQLLTLLVPHKA